MNYRVARHSERRSARVAARALRAFRAGLGGLPRMLRLGGIRAVVLAGIFAAGALGEVAPGMNASALAADYTITGESHDKNGGYTLSAGDTLTVGTAEETGGINFTSTAALASCFAVDTSVAVTINPGSYVVSDITVASGAVKARGVNKSGGSLTVNGGTVKAIITVTGSGSDTQAATGIEACGGVTVLDGSMVTANAQGEGTLTVTGINYSNSNPTGVLTINSGTQITAAASGDANNNKSAEGITYKTTAATSQLQVQGTEANKVSVSVTASGAEGAKSAKAVYVNCAGAQTAVMANAELGATARGLTGNKTAYGVQVDTTASNIDIRGVSVTAIADDGIDAVGKVVTGGSGDKAAYAVQIGNSGATSSATGTVSFTGINAMAAGESGNKTARGIYNRAAGLNTIAGGEITITASGDNGNKIAYGWDNYGGGDITAAGGNIVVIASGVKGDKEAYGIKQGGNSAVIIGTAGGAETKITAVALGSTADGIATKKTAYGVWNPSSTAAFNIQNLAVTAQTLDNAAAGNGNGEKKAYGISIDSSASSGTIAVNSVSAQAIGESGKREAYGIVNKSAGVTLAVAGNGFVLAQVRGDSGENTACGINTNGNLSIGAGAAVEAEAVSTVDHNSTTTVSGIDINGTGNVTIGDAGAETRITAVNDSAHTTASTWNNGFKYAYGINIRSEAVMNVNNTSIRAEAYGCTTGDRSLEVYGVKNTDGKGKLFLNEVTAIGGDFFGRAYAYGIYNTSAALNITVDKYITVVSTSNDANQGTGYNGYAYGYRGVGNFTLNPGAKITVTANGTDTVNNRSRNAYGIFYNGADTVTLGGTSGELAEIAAYANPASSGNKTATAVQFDTACALNVQNTSLSAEASGAEGTKNAYGALITKTDTTTGTFGVVGGSVIASGDKGAAYAYGVSARKDSSSTIHSELQSSLGGTITVKAATESGDEKKAYGYWGAGSLAVAAGADITVSAAGEAGTKSAEGITFTDSGTGVLSMGADASVKAIASGTDGNKTAKALYFNNNQAADCTGGTVSAAASGDNGDKTAYGAEVAKDNSNLSLGSASASASGANGTKTAYGLNLTASNQVIALRKAEVIASGADGSKTAYGIYTKGGGTNITIGDAEITASGAAGTKSAKVVHHNDVGGSIIIVEGNLNAAALNGTAGATATAEAISYWGSKGDNILAVKSGAVVNAVCGGDAVETATAYGVRMSNSGSALDLSGKVSAGVAAGASGTAYAVYAGGTGNVINIMQGAEIFGGINITGSSYLTFGYAADADTGIAVRDAGKLSVADRDFVFTHGGDLNSCNWRIYAASGITSLTGSNNIYFLRVGAQGYADQALIASTNAKTSVGAIAVYTDGTPVTATVNFGVEGSAEGKVTAVNGPKNECEAMTINNGGLVCINGASELRLNHNNGQTVVINAGGELRLNDSGKLDFVNSAYYSNNNLNIFGTFTNNRESEFVFGECSGKGYQTNMKDGATLAGTGYIFLNGRDPEGTLNVAGNTISSKADAAKNFTVKEGYALHLSGTHLHAGTGTFKVPLLQLDGTAADKGVLTYAGTAPTAITDVVVLAGVDADPLTGKEEVLKYGTLRNHEGGLLSVINAEVQDHATLFYDVAAGGTITNVSLAGTLHQKSANTLTLGTLTVVSGTTGTLTGDTLSNAITINSLSRVNGTLRLAGATTTLNGTGADATVNSGAEIVLAGGNLVCGGIVTVAGNGTLTNDVTGTTYVLDSSKWTLEDGAIIGCGVNNDAKIELNNIVPTNTLVVKGYAVTGAADNGNTIPALTLLGATAGAGVSGVYYNNASANSQEITDLTVGDGVNTLYGTIDGTRTTAIATADVTDNATLYLKNGAVAAANIDGVLTQSAGSVATANVHDGGTYIYQDGTVSDINLAGTLQLDRDLTASGAFALLASAPKITGSGKLAVGNLTVPGGVTLTAENTINVSNDVTVETGGELNNSGMLSAGHNAVIAGTAVNDGTMTIGDTLSISGTFTNNGTLLPSPLASVELAGGTFNQHNGGLNITTLAVSANSVFDVTAGTNASDVINVTSLNFTGGSVLTYNGDADNAVLWVEGISGSGSIAGTGRVVTPSIIVRTGETYTSGASGAASVTALQLSGTFKQTDPAGSVTINMMYVPVHGDTVSPNAVMTVANAVTVNEAWIADVADGGSTKLTANGGGTLTMPRLSLAGELAADGANIKLTALSVGAGKTAALSEMNSGVITVGDAAAAGTVTLADNAVLNINGGDLTYAAVSAGNGAVINNSAAAAFAGVTLNGGAMHNTLAVTVPEVTVNNGSLDTVGGTVDTLTLNNSALTNNTAALAVTNFAAHGNSTVSGDGKVNIDTYTAQNGDNFTYANAGTIKNAVVNVGATLNMNGGNLDESATVAGTLNYNADADTDTVTLSGGTVNIADGKTLTASNGVSGYGAVNGGTVNAGANGVTAGGTLNYNASGDLAKATAVSGSTLNLGAKVGDIAAATANGTLNYAGAGTIADATVNGTLNYAGAGTVARAAVNGGTFNYNSGTGAVADLALTNGAFNANAEATVSKLTLAAGKTATLGGGGALTVSALGNPGVIDGTLYVNNTTEFTDGINTINGVLGGTGTVIADVTTNGGAIVPGAAGKPGTLNIQGNVNVSAGDGLAFTVADGGCGQLAVSGTVTLAGNNTITVTGNGGKVGTAYTLVSAAGGLTANDATVDIVNNSALLQYECAFGANDLVCTASLRKDVFNQIANGDANATLARALTAIAQNQPAAMNDVFGALYQMETPAQIARAMTELNAVTAASAGAAMRATENIHTAMGSYFNEAFTRDFAMGALWLDHDTAVNLGIAREGADYSRAGRRAPAETSARPAVAPAAPARADMTVTQIRNAAGELEALVIPMPEDLAAKPARAVTEYDIPMPEDLRAEDAGRPSRRAGARAAAGGAPRLSDEELLTAKIVCAPAPRWGGFLTTVGGFGGQDGVRGAPGSDFRGIGVLAGLERNFGHDLAFGAHIGWAYNRSDLGEGLGKVTDNVLRGGFYGRWTDDRLFAVSAPSVGVHMLDSERRISFLGKTAEGERTGFDVAWFNQAGCAFELPRGFTLTPGASLAMTYLHDPEYTESRAGGANLRVGASDRWSLVSNLGVRLGRPFTLPGLKMALLPEIWGGWEHEYIGGNTLDCAFAAAPGAGWRVEVNDVAANRAVFGAGVSTLFSSRYEAGFRYEGKLWDGGHAHGFSLNFGVRF